MFSAGNICRAALASHRPILASSVSTRAVVSRFLGDKRSRAVNISAINSVITKSKGQGLTGEAGAVGRAAFYLRCQNPEAAISEIDKVFPEIKDEDLKRLAFGIRLKARNTLLDIKEAALKVDGGTTELDVSTLRTALRQDYKDLKEFSPGCWLVEMAAAEYNLYDGNTEVAYNAFLDVEAKIGNYIASLGKTVISNEVANTENTHLSSLVAFQLSRVHVTEGVKPSVSKLVEEGIKNIVEDGSIKDSLSVFKKELGVSLTDEEAAEVAYILDAAHIRHHFHDFFPLETEYNYWNSESANKVKEEIIQFYAPRSTQLENEIIENVKNAVPPQPFYAPEEELQKFISSSGNKNFISELRATFGPGPESVLAKSDEAYFNAMKMLKEAPVSANVAGNILYPERQNEICRKLAKQLLYRTQVNTAVALTELDHVAEAIPILDEVIAANEFIYMWRAYLARGEANKRLGYISKSDKDFRQLSVLKKSFSHEV